MFADVLQYGHNLLKYEILSEGSFTSTIVLNTTPDVVPRATNGQVHIAIPGYRLWIFTGHLTQVDYSYGQGAGDRDYKVSKTYTIIVFGQINFVDFLS